MGPAGRYARRLGARPRRAGAAHGRRRCAGPRLPLLRRLGDVLRSARPQDRRAPSRASCRRRACSFGILGRARRLDRRVRAPRRQRGAVPAARGSLVATLARVRHPAHRHLRPARVQLAEQRVSRSSAATTRCCTTPSSSPTARRRTHPRRPRARARDLPRALLPRRGTTANTMRRARSCARLGATRRSSSRCRARRRCAAARAAAACGWRRRSARASTSPRVEQALAHRRR